ncbi:MAG TPA: isochorismatase family cysteine hydrolase [Syntrophorhabdaceae bacterium]|nr:isochorismatase family cysteine hydrolase [Syntrophorhabdaceae bacterium]
MRPVIIVVDMLEGNYEKNRNPEREEEKIVPLVRGFLKQCRSQSIPVVFACDSFMEKDFIFRGKMKPHAIRGTSGTRPLSDLEPSSADIILEKRRFSAFFKTDLDQTLRTLDIDTVAVCGINTHFCVLATAFDAVCNDFSTVILEDLSAAYKKEIHERCLDPYRRSAIYPIFRVLESSDFLKEVNG